MPRLPTIQNSTFGDLTAQSQAHHPRPIITTRHEIPFRCPSRRSGNRPCLRRAHKGLRRGRRRRQHPCERHRSSGPISPRRRRPHPPLPRVVHPLPLIVLSAAHPLFYLIVVCWIGGDGVGSTAAGRRRWRRQRSGRGGGSAATAAAQRQCGGGAAAARRRRQLGGSEAAARRRW